MTEKANPDLATVQADLAALKRDVKDLVAHMKSAATSSASDAIETSEVSARKFLQDIVNEGERSMKAVGQKVEDQPITALLIAFGVGYLGGRVLSR